jgi:hypothetical protein
VTQRVEGSSQSIAIFGLIPARYLLVHVVLEEFAESG